MTLVVEAPGIPAYSFSYRKWAVRVSKWPSPGEALPVTVDPADPREVEVLWDEVLTGRESAQQEAERMVAMLRRQQQGPPGPGPGPGQAAGPAAGTTYGGVTDVVGQLQQMFPGAVINVDGQPVAPGQAPPAPPAPPMPGGPGGVQVVASQSDADPVVRLEKLARLRDAGIVDEAQFAQLKAQILGQAGVDPPPGG